MGKSFLKFMRACVNRVIPVEAGRWERLGWIVLLLGLAAGLPIALSRTVTDFPHFCAAGKHVLDHGVREPNACLGRYWPSVDVFWIPFTYLPLPLATTIWYIIGCWSLYGLLGAVRRLLVDVDETTRRQATLTAGLLVLPLAVDGLFLGAFHLFMVWLMVAGLHRASQGRWRSGGALLGLAIWIKLLPALGVGYLLLKRKWKPAMVAVACALAIDAAISLAAYGPQTAWDEHVNWWNQWAAGTTNRELTSEVSVDEDRLTNQSVAVTLRRLLSSLGSSPRSPGEATEVQTRMNIQQKVRIANLSAGGLETAYLIVNGLLALGIFAYCRHSGRNTSPGQWSNEIALVVLATLWFSPVVWCYHPTAAAPALAILLARWREQPWRSWAMTVLWLGAIALLAWPVARVAGDLLWLSLAVGAALVIHDRKEC